MNQIMQINNEGGEPPQALLPSGALSLELRSAPAKESARRKIVAAAKKHGIDISDDDKVAHPSSTLRAAHTKRGPRGGRMATHPKRKTTTAQRQAARRNIKKAVKARAKSR